jgi:hypothetical protein
VEEENLDYSCESESMEVKRNFSTSLSLVRGEPVELEFRLINRDTWFNTYADIRNVQLTY